MSKHTNDLRAGCDDTVADGCSSCMASLFRPSGRAQEGGDCPGYRSSAVDGVDRQDASAVCGVAGGSRLLLLTVVAFVLPLVLIVAVVQFLESYVGSAVAAIAGVVAAGLMTVTSAGIMKLVTGRSDVTGAGR